MIWENSKFGKKVGERIEAIIADLFDEGMPKYCVIADYLWEIAEKVNQHHLDRKSMSNLKKISLAVKVTAPMIAAHLEVSEVLVYKWLNGDKPVGAPHCLKICKLLKDKITPYQLRPDVFKRERKSK